MLVIRSGISVKEERKKGLWPNHSSTKQSCSAGAGVQAQVLARASNAAQCLQGQTQLGGINGETP